MISTYDWFIARCKAVLNHSRPPEPPMRVRLHEAGHAVAGHRFGYEIGRASCRERVFRAV